MGVFSGFKQIVEHFIQFSFFFLNVLNCHPSCITPQIVHVDIHGMPSWQSFECLSHWHEAQVIAAMVLPGLRFFIVIWKCVHIHILWQANNRQQPCPMHKGFCGGGTVPVPWFTHEERLDEILGSFDWPGNVPQTIGSEAGHLGITLRHILFHRGLCILCELQVESLWTPRGHRNWDAPSSNIPSNMLAAISKFWEKYLARTASCLLLYTKCCRLRLTFSSSTRAIKCHWGSGALLWILAHFTAASKN